MSTKLERCEHANQLIKAIASHGRKFFWCASTSKTASMQVDSRGKVWFIDDYTGMRIYTHYRGNWQFFPHGGTLRDLVLRMRDYIRTGTKIPIYYIAPNRGDMDGHRDMWGYGNEACEALKAEASQLPIVQIQGD